MNSHWWEPPPNWLIEACPCGLSKSVWVAAFLVMPIYRKLRQNIWLIYVYKQTHSLYVSQLWGSLRPQLYQFSWVHHRFFRITLLKGTWVQSGLNHLITINRMTINSILPTIVLKLALLLDMVDGWMTDYSSLAIRSIHSCHFMGVTWSNSTEQVAIAGLLVGVGDRVWENVCGM